PQNPKTPQLKKLIISVKILGSMPGSKRHPDSLIDQRVSLWHFLLDLHLNIVSRNKFLQIFVCGFFTIFNRAFQ
ncbi:MAG: hypothetical protein ACKO96_09490, partial [Flammeovirgaceae bacterium]